jgi:hypothetical protein
MAALAAPWALEPTCGAPQGSASASSPSALLLAASAGCRQAQAGAACARVPPTCERTLAYASRRTCSQLRPPASWSSSEPAWATSAEACSSCGGRGRGQGAALAGAGGGAQAGPWRSAGAGSGSRAPTAASSSSRAAAACWSLPCRRSSAGPAECRSIGSLVRGASKGAGAQQARGGSDAGGCGGWASGGRMLAGWPVRECVSARSRQSFIRAKPNSSKPRSRRGAGGALATAEQPSPILRVRRPAPGRRVLWLAPANACAECALIDPRWKAPAGRTAVTSSSHFQNRSAAGTMADEK